MLTTNSKGGKQINIGNYMYNVKRKNNIKIIWCCSVRNCQASAPTGTLESDFFEFFHWSIQTT